MVRPNKFMGFYNFDAPLFEYDGFLNDLMDDSLIKTYRFYGQTRLAYRSALDLASRAKFRATRLRQTINTQ